MIKTTILSGTEQKVEFSGNHTHYWVQNLSGGDVLASLSSGITEGADNVLTIPAGGVSYVRDDKGASSVYLLGTGKVQIYGKSNEFCPFKTASGGGDGSGSGEANKIESISVNGQTVAPDANKNVDIEIPDISGDIDAQTVNGHTVESDVPENAIFTDTVYTLPAASETVLGGVLSGGDISVDKNGSVTVNSVNGKTVGVDVPEDAVFTDTTYSLSGSNNKITLTDSNGKTSKVEAILVKTISVAAGETAEIIATEDYPKQRKLRLLAVHSVPHLTKENVWYDGTLTPIGSSSVNGFTLTSEAGYNTVFYTNSGGSVSETVHIYSFTSSSYS